MSIRSHEAVIRVYDEAGNVIETHEAISKENEFIPDSAREKCNHEQDCDPYARDTDDDFVARCHCHFQLSFNFAQRIIDAAREELDFYLVEHPKGFPGTGHPWGYAIYHCNTAANMYSNVHWSYFPNGNREQRYASMIVGRRHERHIQAEGWREIPVESVGRSERVKKTAAEGFRAF
jgi:hypothetical protein